MVEARERILMGYLLGTCSNSEGAFGRLEDDLYDNNDECIAARQTTGDFCRHQTQGRFHSTRKDEESIPKPHVISSLASAPELSVSAWPMCQKQQWHRYLERV